MKFHGKVRGEVRVNLLALLCLETLYFHVWFPPNCSCERSFEHCHSQSFLVPDQSEVLKIPSVEATKESITSREVGNSCLSQIPHATQWLSALEDLGRAPCDESCIPTQAWEKQPKIENCPSNFPSFQNFSYFLRAGRNLERCKGHTHKGHGEKGTESHDFQGISGVLSVSSGSFRVFSGIFFTLPFPRIPFRPFQELQTFPFPPNVFFPILVRRAGEPLRASGQWRNSSIA